MNARDLMTREVIAVQPETPAKHVAKLLLEHQISACPVVDESGTPVGIVSEWDLIFGLLAEGDQVSKQYIARIYHSNCTAKDVMGGPVITVTEETDVSEIARILIEYRIQGVPVVRGGRVVGIVSRADMLRAMVQERVSVAGP